MPIIVSKPFSTYLFLTNGAILIVVASVAGFKIWRSDSYEGKWFGLVISACVFGSGALSNGEVLSLIIHPAACLDYFTGGGYKVFCFIEAFWFMSQAHFWIFGVQYLQTGLKFAFVNSEAYKWVTAFLYLVLLLYVSYWTGSYFY